MSNPARAPKELTSVQLALSAAPSAYLDEGFANAAIKLKNVEEARKVLASCDMDEVAAFYIPRDYTVSDRVLSSNKKVLACAQSGVPVPRVRTSYGMMLVNAAYAELPGSSLLGSVMADDQMSSKVFAHAGTEGSLMRVARAYPKREEGPGGNVTTREAREAVRRCGLSMDGRTAAQLRPYPLLPAEDARGITVNAHSSNGFPVLGTWATPGAAELCQRLAVSLSAEMRQARDVWTWLRSMEADDERRCFVTLLGKTKSDTYKKDKIASARMRFYNVFPRQMMLIMQQATQVLELNYQPMHDADSHSFAGRSLVRGGAEDLVALLQEQMDKRGYAYTHLGDDSWVLLRVDGYIYMFALDCTNFDLTQHGDVTKAVHEAIRDELRRVDVKCADLWYAYARERLVVVTGSLVRRFRHAGASGMPLQSKVNDVLMDVLINRVLLGLDLTHRPDGEGVMLDRIGDVIAREGVAMGFEVRLEQPSEHRASTIIEALEAEPFLFAGYVFHVRGGKVRVCADLPRTLAQAPYPNGKWTESKSQLMLTEAMRLGSIALNLGIPPTSCELAVEKFRKGAMALVEQALRYSGNVEDPRLRWAVQDVPHAVAAQPSLAGLLAALRRDPHLLWTEREKELPSDSILVEMVSPELMSWADIVEDEEEEDLIAAGASAYRPASLQVRRLTLPSGRTSTHPVTGRNDGRPPPVAVWGPDRAPRNREGGIPLRVKLTKGERRDGIRRREFDAELVSSLYAMDLGDSDEEY